jgi:hypothetical protein
MQGTKKPGLETAWITCRSIIVEFKQPVTRFLSGTLLQMPHLREQPRKAKVRPLWPQHGQERPLRDQQVGLTLPTGRSLHGLDVGFHKANRKLR